MSEKEDVDLVVDAEAAESWLTSLSRELGRTLKRGENGIELLVDAAGSALKTTTTITKKIVRLPRRDRTVSSSEDALLEELASMVAECPGGDCSSLKDDVEFWGLVKQLSAVRRKAGKAAAEEDPPDTSTI
jgi:hypothetical protein